MDSIKYKYDYFNSLVLILLVLIAATTVVAYHRVLFNFFAGDDYCHLAWLAAAAKNPQLLMDNFTGPWLGGIVTHFYRPMISIITLLDYLCWGSNATGYHITNLAGLLLAGLFLFFIFDSISKIVLQNNSNADVNAARLWSVAAAGLFALYPLHPEAVSWIIGRVDVISTLFYTASLSFYIWWRINKKIAFLVIALLAATLGLLSKEMVVTLPIIMFAFELLFGNKIDAGKTHKITAATLRAVKHTTPFWLLLGCYAIVRRLALGTFVGGYDASWSFVAGPQLILRTWVHGLQMLFVPINHDFMGGRDWHTRTWEAFVILSFISLAAALITNPNARRLFVFLFIWVAVALLPLYNIFAIGSELQGGRFGYLPSAPLSGLLLLGYFFLNAGGLGSLLLRLCVPCFLLLSANVLYLNNEAWHSNGVELTAIEQGLSKQLGSLPEGSQVLLLNLPDTVHGAYACRNAADGILFRVGAKVDPSHCLAISRFQNSFPSGFLKDSMAANANKIWFLWWDPRREDFVRINPTSSTPDTGSQSLQPTPASGVNYKQLPDGSIDIQSTIPGVRPRLNITSLTGKQCWGVDFLSVRVTVPPGGNIGGPCGCDLIYANVSNPKLGDLHYRAHAALADKIGEQTILFALRGDEAWTFGGKILGCAILLPDQSRLIARDIKVVPAYHVMPRLNFANGDYFHSKGFVSLGQQNRQQLFQYDALEVPGAKNVSVEISRPNVFFEYTNPADTSRTIGRTFIVQGAKGEFSVKENEFPKPGFYSLRLRAVNSGGKNIGLASDHIIILVNR
jgi:hypothetical protein